MRKRDEFIFTKKTVARIKIVCFSDRVMTKHITDKSRARTMYTLHMQIPLNG